MMKLLYTVLYFLKYIVFKDRRSHDFSSKEFNVRQFLTFFLMVFLILVNITLAKRVDRLTDRITTLKVEVESCKAINGQKPSV